VTRWVVANVVVLAASRSRSATVTCAAPIAARHWLMASEK
jgi:hypothetical protein